MRRWAPLALIAIGCGHPAAPATPVGGGSQTVHTAPAADAQVALDDDMPRLAERSLGMYTALQHALADASDCAAATAKVNAVADANADVIAASQRILHAGHAKISKLKAALEPHAADLDAAAKAIAEAPLLVKCSEDPAFSKAFDRLGEAQ